MWCRRSKQDPIVTYKQTHQLEQREQHSWFGERQAKSRPSSVCVNDGFWDEGVCIDYRIRLMGHNSTGLPKSELCPLTVNCATPTNPLTTYKAAEDSVAVCAAVILTSACRRHQKHQNF